MSLPRVRTTILLGTIARVIIAATTGLGIDESYAVAVNRPLALSYFDHPPLVFWMSAAAEAVAGSRAPLAVRSPFLLCFLLTLWLLGWVTRRQFGETAARAAVLAASISGVIGVTGATWVLPDGPLFLGLMLGMTGASIALLPAENGRHASDPRGWWLVGVGAGVAALSKYHAIFLPVGLFVFLLSTKRLGTLMRWRPWAAGAIAAACALPVMAWNATHGWASFRFQSARAAPNAAWSPAPLLENVLGQAVWILPWVWVPLVWVAWRTLRRGPRFDAAWLWCCAAVGPLVLFTGSALLGRRGLPHWQAPGYLLLMPILGAAIAQAIETGRGWVRWWRVAAPIATAATAALLVSQTATGWLRLAPRVDPTRDAVPWDAAARQLPSAPTVVVTHWMDGAKLGAALGSATPLDVQAADARHFAFRPVPPSQTGDVIVRSASRGSMDDVTRRRFGPLDTVAVLPVRRRGVVVDTLFVFRAAQRPGV